jgi:SAM-dependent methyltransferase
VRQAGCRDLPRSMVGITGTSTRPLVVREGDSLTDSALAADADSGSLLSVLTRALRGNMPARYAENWREAFDARVRDALVPGMRILDVGSGRKPTVAKGQRPAGCVYVGLDLSTEELERAPVGSYDEMITADVGDRVVELEGRFDLVLSFQVFEHVKPFDVALENLRSYLRPGGKALLHLSGAYSVFGLLNRLLPHRVGVFLLKHLVGRDPETVFPAHYDRCWYSALKRLGPGWSSFDVLPRWRGASYFGFSRHLRAVYVTYEEWTIRSRRVNLAPYYLLEAVA